MSLTRSSSGNFKFNLAIGFMALLVAAVAVAQSSRPAKKTGSGPAKTNPAPASVPKTPPSTDWPQFGGPTRDFKSSSRGLANSWPESGPRQLWNRPLGEGHSAIVVEGSRLFTMYREVARFWQVGKTDQEIITALDSKTGKTIWEYRYDAPPKTLNFEYGLGPHSTPLVVGNNLYTASSYGNLYCLDKNNGKLIWSHDLLKEFNGTKMDRGYSCSPLAYGNTVIVTVGGKGTSVMAFDQKSGAVIWKNQSFDNSPSSPILINVDGQDQLVVFMADEIAGLNPAGGELYWRHPHPTDYGLNISTPVWGEGNLLFCSSAYSGGSRVLHLTRSGDKTIAKQLWVSNRFRVHHGTAVRIGDYVYGSTGDFGPSFLTAVDVKTGSEAWRDRTFSKASFVYADGKLILLDEDGTLALVTVSPQGLKVLSKVQLLTNKSWTVPTLVGKRLYVRDRKTMMALEVG